MAKTTTKSKKIIINKVENPDGSILIGWKDIEACASDINIGIHRELLKGNLVFALRNPPTVKSDLVQLVIVKNIPQGKQDERGLKSYAIGMITNGWTGYLPYIDWNYLSQSLMVDFRNWSVPEEIIDIYKTTIEKFKYE